MKKSGEEVKQITDYEDFKEHVRPNRRPRNFLYNYGERKINIIHAQLRLKCSNLKAHLYALHVVDDPRCICGGDIEDCRHYFFRCPLYLEQRQALFRELEEICAPSLNVFLYGDDSKDLETNKLIFKSVQMFISSSNRF